MQTGSMFFASAAAVGALSYVHVNITLTCDSNPQNINAIVSGDFIGVGLGVEAKGGMAQVKGSVSDATCTVDLLGFGSGNWTSGQGKVFNIGVGVYYLRVGVWGGGTYNLYGILGAGAAGIGVPISASTQATWGSFGCISSGGVVRCGQ